MSLDRLLCRGALTAAFAVIAATTPLLAAAGEPEGRAEATLQMDVRKLDFENNKKLGLMYMPSGTKVSETRPEGVKKEPKYAGKPKYATLTIGNTEHNTYVVAFDEPDKGDAKIYADKNGNGDLTDDGDGKWDTKIEKEGTAPNYQSTIAFNVHWKNEDGKETSGDFALNFYRSPDRDSINYYRASARTGKIDLGGKSYEITLFESDCDGLYNKLYDPSKPTPFEKLPKPVFLMLDGDQYDIRGTFAFGGYNYLAKASADGSKLVLEPTAKVITLPRPTSRQQMVGAGGPIPEFEAVWWKPDVSAKPETFKITDFKGKKIVVLDMWATWCGPCMRGIPHISKVAEEVKGQDVEVIAMNVWDDQNAFERWASEKGKNYAFKLARDPAGKEPKDATIPTRLFKMSGIPATYVIDKNGKIAASISGYTEGDKQLEYALVRLGVKIPGIKPEDAAEKPVEKSAVPMKSIPATGLK